MISLAMSKVIRRNLDTIPDRFRCRLRIDPEVSTISPVIIGTDITVENITNLVYHGFTWRSIIRVFPDITTDGIRTALAYYVWSHEEQP